MIDNEEMEILTRSGAESLERGLVAEGVLAGLDHELKAGVDALLSLVLYVQTTC